MGTPLVEIGEEGKAALSELARTSDDLWERYRVGDYERVKGDEELWKLVWAITETASAAQHSVYGAPPKGDSDTPRDLKTPDELVESTSKLVAEVPEFEQAEFKCLSDLKKCKRLYAQGGPSITCALLFSLCIVRQLVPLANIRIGDE